MKEEVEGKQLSPRTYNAIRNALFAKGCVELYGMGWWELARDMTDEERDSCLACIQTYRDRMFSLEALADLGLTEIKSFSGVGELMLKEIKLAMEECGIVLKDDKKSRNSHVIPIKRPCQTKKS